jgi:hypothetical protein
VARALFARPNSEAELLPMICPYCLHEIAETWQPVYICTDYKGQPLDQPSTYISARFEDYTSLSVALRWMQCPNGSCRQVLVTVHRAEREAAVRRSPMIENVEEWFAVPRKRSPRPIDQRVPLNFKRDYIEASLILEDSHRMSGVLSRRILSDLLKKYAGRHEKTLDAQINKFINDPAHVAPTVKDNLHYLREIGNFGAHTQNDLVTGEIVEASTEEAEWALSVIDGLFDYFIVEPERNKERRASFAEKIKNTGRKPIE